MGSQGGLLLDREAVTRALLNGGTSVEVLNRSAPEALAEVMQDEKLKGVLRRKFWRDLPSIPPATLARLNSHPIGREFVDEIMARRGTPEFNQVFNKLITAAASGGHSHKNHYPFLLPSTKIESESRH